MIKQIITGIAAGLASALMAAAQVSGSLLSVPLYFLAPIPIVIVALAFDHRTGLIGAIVGSVALAIGLHPLVGLNFALGGGLPAWWLAYLVLLARGEGEAREWYSLGRLLYWIAGLSSVLVGLTILAIGADYETYAARLERFVELFMRFNPQLTQGLPEAARAAMLKTIAGITAAIMPPVMAALAVVVTTFVLWAGAKSVAKSGKLPRPWPEVAGVALPRSALIALAVALPFALLGEYPGLIARMIFAALLAAFGLQGLAVIHQVTKGMTLRSGLLAALYVVTLFSSGWTIVLFGLVGIADHFLDFRGRASARQPPPPFLPPSNSTDDRRSPWK